MDNIHLGVKSQPEGLITNIEKKIISALKSIFGPLPKMVENSNVFVFNLNIYI